MKKKGLFLRRQTDRLARMAAFAAVLTAAGAMLWILYTVAGNGLEAFSWEFFRNSSRPYGIPGGGIANAMLGTLLITSGAAILAIPPGVCAGIFLAEYREFPRLALGLRFAANVLMGLPSVLVGLFVYIILVTPMGHFSGLAGSAALAIIMFPVVMRTTEDMLRMVPDALRESALALGMSRTRATLRIVCRTAWSGLLPGVLLALARVAGETAPLLFTALFADGWPAGYFSEPTPNLPVLITEYSTNSPFAAMHRAGWGAALVVTALVLAINLTTRIIFREKKHHGH